MDLKQRKLNKSEWESIEVPVSPQEIEILKLIVGGYHNVNIRVNNKNSIFTFLKLEYSEKMEDYLYNNYLRERGDKIEAELKKIFKEYKPMKSDTDVKLNSGQKIRLERYDENSLKQNDLYEYVLLSHIENIIFNKKENKIKLFHFHYFTLYKLMRNSIARVNRTQFVHQYYS